MGIITNAIGGGNSGQQIQIIEVSPGSATSVTITSEQASIIRTAPEKVIIRSKNTRSFTYRDYIFTSDNTNIYHYSSAEAGGDGKLFSCSVNGTTISFYSVIFQTAYAGLLGYTIRESNYDTTTNLYKYLANIINDNCSYRITISVDITHTDANLSIPIPSGYWINSNQLTKVTIVKGSNGYDTILIPVKGLNTGEPTIYLSLDKDSGIATILIEESPNPTCYDTNETIDFTSIMAEYQADITKVGKLRPFTNSDTLLSSEAIKAIISGNYKMFSFNAQIGSQVMKAYMSISYETGVNYYTFKGQVTILDNSVWGIIDVQMQFIHNSNDDSYENNPGYGFFKYTAESVISA